MIYGVVGSFSKIPPFPVGDPPMFTISKEFHFSASHQLDGLPADHPCSRLHGHNYRVRLVFTMVGEVLHGPGFVIDYRSLDTFKDYLNEEVDHRHLNEVFTDINPTAELLAHKFYDLALKLNPYPLTVALKVDVSETDKTWASYEPDLLLGDPS
jgi:6-pyruvoyltetrahydropterin/6-carboxytetrahydropterin synthase